MTAPRGGVDPARRTFLRLSAVGLLASLAARGSAQAAEACYDPASLPASQKGMRSALGFKPVAPDPKSVCGLCTFYKPIGQMCGSCALLSGGPVGASSVCDSFARKG